MEWFGLIAFSSFLLYASYEGKLKILESKIRKLQIMQKGDPAMSKLLSELVGKRCKLTLNSAFSSEQIGIILDVDEEWIKFSYKNRKGQDRCKLERIDNITSIQISNIQVNDQ